MIIRDHSRDDEDGIWRVFSQVVATGDTYVFEPGASRAVMEQHWLVHHPFVAVVGGQVAGTYILKPNQLGLGSHIANASYMVLPELQGKGIGRALAEHSLRRARQLGFTGMQFNLVVSTNHRAIRLWENLGFTIIGTVPGAFRHQGLGLVDAHIMYRSLEGPENTGGTVA